MRTPCRPRPRVELLHNFSLIHDDVEDDSPTRRHRPTVWALWGVPQAINAGDAMFTLARLALHGLRIAAHPARRMAWTRCTIFDDTCLRLTEGQYLDMSFEGRLDVSRGRVPDHDRGKTAALLSASLELGALVGGADRATRRIWPSLAAAWGWPSRCRTTSWASGATRP